MVYYYNLIKLPLPDAAMHTPTITEPPQCFTVLAKHLPLNSSFTLRDIFGSFLTNILTIGGVVVAVV